MYKSILAGAVLLASVTAGAAIAQDAKPYWPAGSQVYFISPKNGETVSSPVTVIFGLKGMGVAPAGIEKEKTGHHHVLINTPLPENLDEPIVADEKHKHFGGGQTQTSLELPAGKHTLQLLVGDHNHIPHKPPLASEVITITVK